MFPALIKASLTSPWGEAGFQSDFVDIYGPERMTSPGLAEKRRPCGRFNCGGLASYNRSTVVLDKELRVCVCMCVCERELS